MTAQQDQVNKLKLNEMIIDGYCFIDDKVYKVLAIAEMSDLDYIIEVEGETSSFTVNLDEIDG